MKSILQLIAEKNRNEEQAEKESVRAELNNPATSNDRRNFLKKAALGGIALGGLIHLSVEDTIAQTTQSVSRASSPSDLKITDLRFAEMGGSGLPARIIRIDTNQGIYGLGDIRDGTDQRFALFLKSKIVGLNPCNVEMIFKVIKQFGGHGRQGGGVSAVEMALWDLCGKALNVPVWQLLGGRYRDKVRIYADTPDEVDPAKQIEALKRRVASGYTWLKMDIGMDEIAKDPECLVNSKFWSADSHNLSDWYQGRSFASGGYTDYWKKEQPFTQVQITDKGLEGLQRIVENVRNVVGTEIPLSADHFGHIDMNQIIRIGKAVEKYRLAWLEDTVAWFYTDQLKAIKAALETPILTGEDIYLLNNGDLGGFKKLIDERAVDIVHPDLVSAGGILETKKIGDYAEDAGIAMALHANSTPVAWMANVHCAAATENFLALEHHKIDVPEWEGMVKMTGSQPMITKGFANVPLDAPGLGIELNEEQLKAMMPKGAKLFEPTPEWNGTGRTYDKSWI